MAKPQPVYQVDRETSKQRAKDLQSYLTKRVAKTRLEEMVCTSYPACKASAERREAEFFEAQGYGVGPCFDLSTADSVPFRVLIVPMEAGGGGKYASIADRRNEPLKPCQKRNQHMKGVTFALQLAFGLPVTCSDPEGEMLNFTNSRQPAHLFDCYAMTNLLLCSAVPNKDSNKSLATSVMRRNCARHLQAAIGILQPTLVISQGWGLVDTLWESLGVTYQVNLNVPDCYLTDCDLNGNRFVWVALYHPTRHWSTINRTMFQKTVVPAITAARRRALKLAQTV